MRVNSINLSGVCGGRRSIMAEPRPCAVVDMQPTGGQACLSGSQALTDACVLS